jgi:hypothetical protein
LEIHIIFNLNLMTAIYLKAALKKNRYRIGLGASPFEK